MKRFVYSVLTLLAVVALPCCSSDDDKGIVNPIPDPVVPQDSVSDDSVPALSAGYVKGADVSWLTEMEKAGKKFYTSEGQPQECMSLLKDMGVNAIRLRVWVNPADGWCAKEDVLVKALRAKSLGLRLMVDFHYSDSWADPGKQPIPAAWKGYTIAQLAAAVADHTIDVLQTLKTNNIVVDWVQVGNETNQGMLWDKNEVAANNGFVQHQSFANFVRLVNSGYDAVKSVYPDAKVIVHTSNGHDIGLFTWMYDGLKKNSAKYDVIGMSLYPEPSDWLTTTNKCLANISVLSQRYGKEVMVCEVGTPWDASYAAAFMRTVVEGTKQLDCCLGVFYWEPQCYGGWKGYSKGAFNNLGRPTTALKEFK